MRLCSLTNFHPMYSLLHQPNQQKNLKPNLKIEIKSQCFSEKSECQGVENENIFVMYKFRFDFL